MKSRRNLAIAFIGALLMLANQRGAVAQETTPAGAPPKQTGDVLIERHNITIQTPDGRVSSSPAGNIVAIATGNGMLQDGTVNFISSEMSPDNRVVKGAPYSALAVTERAQVLGDGNRLTHKFTNAIYRDSEGRTRNELSFSGIGPYAADKLPKIVTISDPVAGVHYFLNTVNHTARKIEIPRFIATWSVPEGRIVKNVRTVYPPAAIAAGVQGKVKVVADVNEAGEIVSAKAIDGDPLLQQAAIDTAKQLRLKPVEQNGAPVKVQRNIFFDFVALDKQRNLEATPNRPTDGSPAPLLSNAESLGTQTIEGVLAEGARSTITIPAGQLGNELPIKVVTERWYSPELKTVVLSKHNDPRIGVNTYRLTNIVRAEPDHTLFEVPADYTIKTNEPTAVRTLRMKKTKEE